MCTARSTGGTVSLRGSRVPVLIGPSVTVARRRKPLVSAHHVLRPWLDGRFPLDARGGNLPARLNAGGEGLGTPRLSEGPCPAPCQDEAGDLGAPFGRLPCGLRVGAPACDRAVALAGAVTWERRHPACAGLRYPSLSARSFQLRALRLVGPTRLKRPVGQFGVAGCFPVSTWWCIAGGRSSGRVRSHSQADLKQECAQRLMGSRIETARSSPR